MKKVLCLLLFLAGFLTSLEKTAYPLLPELIDVVIPCCAKDKDSLRYCIKGIRKNGENIRRIIVISAEPLTDEAEWFDERNYPFTKQDLLFELFRNQPEKAQAPFPRIGWIYQQLLKLYAFSVIPNLSSNILILDADTVFLNPVRFIDSHGNPFFTRGKEHHQPYFDHAKRLLPEFRKVFPKYSGVTHHMLFQKPILEDLFVTIVAIHAAEPWQAIIRCIDPSEAYGASFSEYEIYFNFAFLRTEQAKLRKLKWTNIPSLELLKEYKKKGYDYASCHVY